jgi:putative ABC transport system permease protein
MLKNYFKVAWRYMLKNKIYSILNIAGLTAGMAVALLIGFWIHSQFSYDRFLPGYNQLFQVKLNFNYNGDIKTQTGASLPIIDELRTNYPEVKYASETDWGSQHSLLVADKKLSLYGLSVGTDFLKMFSFTLVKGNANTVFDEPNAIVLTESIAKALFGDEDPVNKMIRIDNQTNAIVTGILKDVPTNSTLQFTYLLPYSSAKQKEARAQWANYSYPEYVQLQPGTNADAFGEKIKNMLVKHDPAHKIELILQPAKNWRLLTGFSNGKATSGLIEYVRMFGVIGILVLIIACINFTNLCTARSEKRAREVGVRKAIGSQRKHLILQFLSESMLLTFIAFLVSLVIVQLLLPYFNKLTSADISIPYSNPIFWCIMVGYVLFTGILAGSRPAFYLSSFKPVRVLKGSIESGKNTSLPQKILVVVQFSCSIALIIGTLIIYQQISYVKDRPKGYNADQLIMTNSSHDLNKNYSALRDDLLKSGKVISVTKAASPITYFPASFTLTEWPGKKPEESLEMVTTAISQDYFKTIGMTLKAGRDFTGDAGPDTLNIILNEAAVERLKLKEPLSQLITFNYSKTPMRVIGVVKNALIESPFFAVRPAIFVYNPGWASTVMYRLNPNADTREAITKISGIFNKYNPSFPYDYQFADEAFDAKFNLEVLIGKLAGIFAGLAIFISCLGLFGLAAYVAEQRKKEIGIRKVLGASVPEIWFLLSRNFLLLVIISCFLASFISFYFLQSWLQKFEYRITIGPAVFLLSAGAAIIITILTVSYQSVNSALANPVKSLRGD